MKRFIVLVFALLFLFYVAWPGFSGYQINQALAAKDTGMLDQKIDFPGVRKSMREPVLVYVEKRLGAVVNSVGPLKDFVGSDVPTAKVARYVDAAIEDVVNPDGLVRIYAEGGDFSVEIQRAFMKQIDKAGGVLAFFKRTGKGSESGSAGGGAKKSGGIKLPGGVDGLLGGGAAAGIVGDVLSKIDGLDASKLTQKLFPDLSRAKKNSDRYEGDGASDNGSFGLGNIKSFGFDGPLAMELGVASSEAATQPDVTAQIGFENFDWRVKKLTPNL